MPAYDDQEWPLRLCRVKEAWDLILPSHGQGKAKGEGIVILHPDTGWTEHPELLKGSRYLNSDYKISRNFLVSTPTTDDSYWAIPDSDWRWDFRIQRPTDKLAKDILDHGLNGGLHPSHGTGTAGLMLSEEGHPNPAPPASPIFPAYTVPQANFITGIAPLVKVIPCRICRSVILGIDTTWKVNTFTALAQAIYHGISLVDQNIGVISISLGGVFKPNFLTDALKAARQNGIIVIAAAGQFAGDLHGVVSPIFPGNSPHTLCVAGCYEDLSQPKEGFYGIEVDITTPGWAVTVARTKGPPPNFIIDPKSNGTSYSTALTAGACALWQAYHNRDLLIKKYGRPFLLDAFRYVLANTVEKPAGWDNINRGMGVLNVEKLLSLPLPSVATVELVANSNDWPSTEWGDSSKWGRV
ncbi:S8 family peptidase [Flavobacterium sp. UBA4854]|uniref:S8 family peptidase n=1 Tax=Flavobacterium sp. UBA4854 TaxID=1946548 RepID=UPI00257BEBAA|nr:S8/S53 family peptidase [Flavobacterium sp. UBA4854]